MATLFSLLLSAALFLWELLSLTHAYTTPQTHMDGNEAALLHIRSILIFVCAPFLWGAQILKFLGWLPWSDEDSPKVLQMKMFAWTLNAILTGVFVWKLLVR